MDCKDNCEHVAFRIQNVLRFADIYFEFYNKFNQTRFEGKVWECIFLGIVFFRISFKTVHIKTGWGFIPNLKKHDSTETFSKVLEQKINQFVPITKNGNYDYILSNFHMVLYQKEKL